MLEKEKLKPEISQRETAKYSSTVGCETRSILTPGSGPDYQWGKFRPVNINTHFRFI